MEIMDSQEACGDEMVDIPEEMHHEGKKCDQIY